MRLSALVIGTLVLSTVALDSSTVAGDDKDEVVKVTAKQLLEDYKPDEKEKDPKLRYKAADEKYKGKTLEITGVVKKASGSTHLALEGGTGFKVVVYCAFGKENQKNLDALRKAKKLADGDKVVVKGTCAGIKVDTVRIDDCIMIDPPFPK